MPSTAPEYFSLDDWGYASLIGDGTVPEGPCGDAGPAGLPVHAIIYMGEHRPSSDGAAHHDPQESPEPEPKTDDNEAISGFIR